MRALILTSLASLALANPELYQVNGEKKFLSADMQAFKAKYG